MNIEDFRDHCIQKPGVTESFPFDNDTLVFKVMDKMFALCNIENFESANTKPRTKRKVTLNTQKG
jgi:predicted DNA-binding protein (MmcQ/YjbR family)